MSISANDTIWKFGGSDVVTVSGGTSAVTSGSYSASGDCISGGWTNTDDATRVSAVLVWQYPSGTITTGGIQLMCRLLNNSSTTDEPALTANWKGH